MRNHLGRVENVLRCVPRLYIPVGQTAATSSITDKASAGRHSFAGMLQWP